MNRTLLTANKLLRSNGSGGFTDVTFGPVVGPGAGRGCAWADYDGDGDLDLYVADDGASNKLFRNHAADSNHWLQVTLQGTESNRSAIGARVRVVALAGTLKQVREIGTSGGYHSQNPLSAAFGLGTAGTVDSLIIRWPSGNVQIETGLTPPPGKLGQLLSRVEPTCQAAVPVPVASTMSAWAVDNADPNTMTLHFTFNTSHISQQVQVRYRVAGTTTWSYYALCSSANPWCIFSNSCGTRTYEEITFFSPCDETKFEWQAQAYCQTWSSWTPTTPKVFTAYCLTGGP